MLKKILLVFVLIIAGILAFAATKPDDFSIERSIAIKAPPEKLFAIVNDHHRWSEWSPWDKLDPGMKRTFSGASSGVGANFAWEGNSQVGSGRNEIVESVPPSKIGMKLYMLSPMETTNDVTFTFVPQGESTKVTWRMFGKQPYIGKLINVFIDCDKMVGGMFEEGLSNLKAAAER